MRLGGVANDVVFLDLPAEMEEHQRPGGQEDVDAEPDDEDHADGQPGRGQHEQERQHEDLQIVAVAPPLAQLERQQEQHEVEKR